MHAHILSTNSTYYTIDKKKELKVEGKTRSDKGATEDTKSDRYIHISLYMLQNSEK